MNFQFLPLIEKSSTYLDHAFHTARKKSDKQLVGNWLQKIRKKETIKIDVITAELNTRLNKILADFPVIEQLPPFYRELAPLTLDVPAYRQSLKRVRWAAERLIVFQKTYAPKVTTAKTKEDIYRLMKEYYGRTSSVFQRLDPALLVIDNTRKIFKNYPDIKDLPTICIFGFPNVGKTTLLNQLTGSKAKIAAYAFTTKGINVGYLAVDGKKIQLLDVPGTLARKEKRNFIEQIAYAALKIAEAVIYVFDPTESYPLADQEALRQTIETDKKVLIYASKTDLVDEEQWKVIKKKYRCLSSDELLQEIQRLETAPRGVMSS